MLNRGVAKPIKKRWLTEGLVRSNIKIPSTNSRPIAPPPKGLAKVAIADYLAWKDGKQLKRTSNGS